MLCIDKHPTQPHLIVTGGQDGVLGLWDMRQDRYPVTLLEAHSAESMTIFVLFLAAAEVCLVEYIGKNTNQTL